MNQKASKDLADLPQAGRPRPLSHRNVDHQRGGLLGCRRRPRRRAPLPADHAGAGPTADAARRDRTARRRPGAIRKPRPQARSAVLRDAMMKVLIAFLLASLLGAGPAAASQIPPEWQAAAQAVIGELERDTPQAARPWGNELTDGWNPARLWRRYNNRNSEIIPAEYLTFAAVGLHARA